MMVGISSTLFERFSLGSHNALDGTEVAASHVIKS
jgi:hypothetical protein